MNLVVTREAAADLDRLRAFLAEKDAGTAQSAVAALVRAIDSLELFPERGVSSAVSGLRELIVPYGRSAYVVRFRHDAQREEVVILRIWHGREERS